MQTPKRHPHIDVIRELLEAPGRFDFMQAICLLQRWLEGQGGASDHALATILRFRNSVSMAFPSAELEDVSVATVGDGTLEFCLTPAFISLLGAQGALPRHYTERITQQTAASRSDGARAFLDIFLNRLAALFYLAWRSARPELSAINAKQPALHTMLAALSGDDGDGQTSITSETTAFYAGVFRHRPAPAALIERVLSAYFNIPVEVTPNLGAWHDVAPASQMRLSGNDCPLGVRSLLGPREWRRDLDVGIRLGPLDRNTYDRFLPRQPDAIALRQMLSRFELPCLRFEIRLLLDPSQLIPVQLLAGQDVPGVRLGYDSVLPAGSGPREHEYRYTVTLY